MQFSVVQRSLSNSNMFAGVRIRHLVDVRKTPLKISQLQHGCHCHQQI